ncbi:MAG: hypothetical protein RL159_45 [Actinomycetota bacterium]
MVAVPMLIYVFGMTPVQATTASLIIVFSGALSGVISKFKSKDVLVKESLSIWAIGLATNFGGAYVLPKISESIILTGFSLVLISAGISMLLKPPIGGRTYGSLRYRRRVYRNPYLGPLLQRLSRQSRRYFALHNHDKHAHGLLCSLPSLGGSLLGNTNPHRGSCGPNLNVSCQTEYFDEPAIFKTCICIHRICHSRLHSH